MIDDWARPRVGAFFTANSDNTLNDGDLTGQCVSLVKWFLKDNTPIQNPGMARGHAKDYGDTLVRQGLADVVPYANRQAGDIVVWKSDGGGYGHIAMLLSGDRVFEQNVGLAGTAFKYVDGQKVYAARIDPLTQSWRKGSATIYRLKSYNNGGGDMNITREQIRWHYHTIAGVFPTEQEIKNYEGKDYVWATEDIKRYFANNNGDAWAYRKKAEELQAQVTQLQSKIKEGTPVSQSSKDSESLRKIREGLGLA